MQKSIKIEKTPRSKMISPSTIYNQGFNLDGKNSQKINKLQFIITQKENLIEELIEKLKKQQNITQTEIKQILTKNTQSQTYNLAYKYHCLVSDVLQNKTDQKQLQDLYQEGTLFFNSTDEIQSIMSSRNILRNEMTTSLKLNTDKFQNKPNEFLDLDSLDRKQITIDFKRKNELQITNIIQDQILNIQDVRANYSNQQSANTKISIQKKSINPQTTRSSQNTDEIMSSLNTAKTPQNSSKLSLLRNKFEQLQQQTIQNVQKKVQCKKRKKKSLSPNNDRDTTPIKHIIPFKHPNFNFDNFFNQSMTLDQSKLLDQSNVKNNQTYNHFVNHNFSGTFEVENSKVYDDQAQDLISFELDNIE